MVLGVCATVAALRPLGGERLMFWREAERRIFFSSISEHADGERRRPAADLSSQLAMASHRDLLDAALRSVVAPRRSPSACSERTAAALANTIA